MVEVYNKSSLNIVKGDWSNGQVGYYALNVYTPTSGSGGVFETTEEGYVFYSYSGSNYLINYIGNETNIELPESYKGGSYKINQYAFDGNTNITSITIPDSVTGIGSEAFSGCTSLESVSFGDNSLLESIDSYAFRSCTSLESITIPDSVTSIGSSAFYNCTSLKTVSFGDNSLLESIGYGAFSGCTSLESITIPDSVTSIGFDAFRGCTSLRTITFEDTSGWYIDGSEIDVTDPENNVLYFTSTYLNYYWYKN